MENKRKSKITDSIAVSLRKQMLAEMHRERATPRQKMFKETLSKIDSTEMHESKPVSFLKVHAKSQRPSRSPSPNLSQSISKNMAQSPKPRVPSLHTILQQLKSTSPQNHQTKSNSKQHQQPPPPVVTYLDRDREPSKEPPKIVFKQFNSSHKKTLHREYRDTIHELWTPAKHYYGSFKSSSVDLSLIKNSFSSPNLFQANSRKPSLIFNKTASQGKKKKKRAHSNASSEMLKNLVQALNLG